ncbi:helix-turn-helix domain-containing protein [Roseivivax sediminis]|uniref:Helix-turn-helix domain-containing protein n=1 Tax=Roseivivax sediminis TaxID=936889 RepID=A0A1I1V5N8_9RHOB|nr:AraC family transcriptional regulator [Roseivivax sediminis]SFD78214.1 Helix-turn-helix domain-containing protein [Roseivivax sediminis]
MSFRPDVTSFLSGIRPAAPLVCGFWHGAVADLWRVEVGRDGHGAYTARDPRFVVVLDEGESPLRLSGPGFDIAAPVRVAYVPAGLAVRSRFSRGGHLTHLDLHFDAASLHHRLDAAGLDAAALMARPIALPEAPDVAAIARLLAGELDGGAGSALVQDSLGTALAGKVLAGAGRAVPLPARGGLTPRQLARVDALMLSQMRRRLPVSEMAASVGLSESRFAHAFRESRGQSPHRALQTLRVASAQRLLRDPARSIADIAAEVGFADQAHLTRAFGAVIGQTPGAWRRAQHRQGAQQDRTIPDSFDQDRGDAAR